MNISISESKEIGHGAAQLIGDDPQRASQLAEILKALAHPIRLRIIAVLSQSELNVNALAERLGYKQAIISQQLRILRMRRLVDAARCDGFAVYRIIEPRLYELLRCMQGCNI